MVYQFRLHGSQEIAGVRFKVFGRTRNGRVSGVCVVGPLPPPVHGAAVVNASVVGKLIEMSVYTIQINLSPKSLSRRSMNRLGRLPKVGQGLLKAARINSDWVTLYMSLSGGLGQVYEIFFIVFARLFGKRIFLHHHSFAYLDKRSLATGLLTFIAGSNTTHIVLCERMAGLLRERYPSVRNVFVVSNSSIIDFDTRKRNYKTQVQTVGYLGNISSEKGIFRYIGVMEALANNGKSVKGLIAGPFENIETESRVIEALSKSSTVSYVGPKYGVEKSGFYEDIDVLLFPSNYANEAEPLTVYESLAAAVPVIAWDRGCISEMLSPDCGYLVDQEKDFIEEATQQLLLWKSKPTEFRQVSQNCADLFDRLRQRWSDDYGKLLCLVAGRTFDPVQH